MSRTGGTSPFVCFLFWTLRQNSCILSHMKNQMQIHDAGGKRLYLTHEHHSEFTRSDKCRSFNKAKDAILNGRTQLIDALIESYEVP